MRVVYLLILLVLLGATAIFALQNQGPVTLRYLDRAVTSPLSALIAVVYFVGMLTGWTVIGVVRRSLRRVSARARLSRSSWHATIPNWRRPWPGWIPSARVSGNDTSQPGGYNGSPKYRVCP